MTDDEVKQRVNGCIPKWADLVHSEHGYVWPDCPTCKVPLDRLCHAQTCTYQYVCQKCGFKEEVFEAPHNWSALPRDLAVMPYSKRWDNTGK